MSDYSRQNEIFNNETFFPRQYKLLGCGATGSWVTIMLAKMGVSNVTCWDFDKVEEHNLPNQFFDKHALGAYKSEELVEICSNF